jgi:putative endonuclease
MASVYILYSKKLDKFYTGSCLDFHFGLEQHLHKVYPGSFTSNSDDWQLFLLIENLSYAQARSVETHIKKMKSKAYIQNLAKIDIRVSTTLLSENRRFIKNLAEIIYALVIYDQIDLLCVLFIMCNFHSLY